MLRKLISSRLAAFLAAFALAGCGAVGAPCAVPYFEELGFVTLAFMALSAFALVAALLAADRAWDRAARPGTS